MSSSTARMPSSIIQPFKSVSSHILREELTDSFPLSQSDIDDDTTVADSVITGMYREDDEDE